LLEQLKYLVEFQILEDKKAQLIRGCQDTPKRLADVQKEFDQYEAEYLSKKTEQDLAKKTHKSLEQNIADLEVKIARSKNRMSEVKTNKEYQAIVREIDDLKKEITAKEDGMLEAMERIESLGAEIQALEKEVEAHRKVLEENKKQLQQEIDQLKEKLDHLEALQQKVRDKMEPNLLKRTNFLLSKQCGIAVAAVENSVCQICHLNIPPQKFIELQRDDAIHQCPHCHRFLYWTGHEQYAVVQSELSEL
jgi:predicted  nucleic acid-binding Zn-ribbon protein